jgi:hypothetical protein
MDKRIGGSRGKPKRVTLSVIDEWMQSYAHPPDAPELPPDNLPDEVEVFGSLRASLAMWVQWREHGGGYPRAGGYLDQPRKWRHMIELFNDRFSRAYHAAQDKELNWADLSDDPIGGLDNFFQD